MTSLDSFQQVASKSRQIQSEVRQLDSLSKTRTKKFNASIEQYRTYIRKQNELLDRNFKHCQQHLSWRNAIANRHIILRSVARTNVLKKDLDDWLQRVDPNAFHEDHQQVSRSMTHEEHLQGSQLIDKYNQILLEYGHKI